MFALSFLFGVAIGVISASLLIRSVGVIRIDQSDPDDRPYLFLEINRGCYEKLLRSKKVIFEVRKENYISQK